MRKPSPETELRNLWCDYNGLRTDWLIDREDRDTYRARATKAEQEIIEWKRRFDALLKIVPEKLA